MEGASSDGLQDEDQPCAIRRPPSSRCPGVASLNLSDEFGSDEQARRHWREFMGRMRIDNAPTDFAAVVTELRERLSPAAPSLESLEM